MMLYAKIIAFAIICYFLKTVKGILCLACDNQPSHEECLRHGKITRCMSDQDSCLTYVQLYRNWPNGRLITKSCKQTKACIVGFLQNSHLCKPYRPSAVCTCCCHYSRCNMKTNDKCWIDYSRTVPPEKIRDSCKSLQMVFKNGRIECTDGYHLGSICRFRPTGTKLHTEMRSKCIKNKRGFLSWKRISNQTTKTEERDKQTNAPGGLKSVNKQSPAEIRELRCNAANATENQTVSCTNRNLVGSKCTFKCDKDFVMNGIFVEEAHTMTCKLPPGSSIPEWDGLPPFCVPVKKSAKRCEALSYDESDFLDVTCSNETIVGSDCTFRCVVGYMVTPFESTTITCEEVSPVLPPQWTSPVPTCKPLSCDRFVVDRGVVSCKNEFFFDSSCNVTCLSGYTLLPPDFSSTTCLSSLLWTRPPPVCIPIRCSDFVVTRAKVQCTNGFFFNSSCFVSCNSNHDYYITPSDFTSSRCMANSTWSRDLPCCEKSCSSNSPIDMVIILDSSRSIGFNYWKKMKKFVISLIKYVKVGPNSTNFAVFQYSKNVNSVTEILLNQYNNKTALLKKVAEMPYQGKGTWTGIALRHAANVSLHPANGNRLQFPDVVVVVTDGQVNENDDPLPPAKMLLEKGAKVFEVGQEFMSPRKIYQAVLDLVCKKVCG